MADDSDGNGREWYPFDYAQDEVLPPDRASPHAWLRRYPEGWAIDHQFFDDDEAAQNGWTPDILADGRKIVFVYVERLPDAVLIVSPDGSFVATVPPDPKATNFYDQDSEAWGDSAAEFAKNFADCGSSVILSDLGEGMSLGTQDKITEPTSVGVDCSYWSDRLVYSLIVDGDTARLVEAGSA